MHTFLWQIRREQDEVPQSRANLRRLKISMRRHNSLLVMRRRVLAGAALGLFYATVRFLAASLPLRKAPKRGRFGPGNFFFASATAAICAEALSIDKLHIYGYHSQVFDLAVDLFNVVTLLFV